jgi:hypothetical protein
MTSRSTICPDEANGRAPGYVCAVPMVPTIAPERMVRACACVCGHEHHLRRRPGMKLSLPSLNTSSGNGDVGDSNVKMDESFASDRAGALPR